MKEAVMENKEKIQMINPRMFILIILIGSFVMVFSALTSAYLVKKSDGGWQTFDLPAVLQISTLVVLLSSATMHWAVMNAKKDEIGKIKLGILLTAALGAAFLALQYVGWQHLNDMGIYLSGNPSGSFLYILTGLHGAHIVSGLIYLFIALGLVYRAKIHSKSLNPIQMCATYWHFLTVLWVYLFIFLTVSR